MDVFSPTYLPKFLYFADLELLHDALIDYPYGVNASDDVKAQVREEIKLREVWAD
jgi:hypothetical protein